MFKEFNVDNLENSKELVENLLNENREEINKLLEIENKTYKNFVLPFQEIGECINDFLTPIFHIDSVKNSEITTKVYEECIPLISKYETDISQNEDIYIALKTIQSNENSSLNNIQNKVLKIAVAELEKDGFNQVDLKNKVILEINSYIIEETGRRPIIIPIILDIKRQLEN